MIKRKIFFGIFTCAMLVGVSCTTDNNDGLYESGVDKRYVRVSNKDANSVDKRHVRSTNKESVDKRHVRSTNKEQS